MRLFAALAVAVSLAMPASAQENTTLSDIRSELALLYVEILSLQQLLDPSGVRAGTSLSDSTLERVTSIERSLQALTSRTEELEFQIGRVVADATNRIGDLEFRVCEIDEGCDIGDLGETPLLGGVEGIPAGTSLGALDLDGDEQLAVTEKNDFEAAQIALEEQRYQAAADLFEQFVETYPGGPLGIEAQMGRGEALELLGEYRDAARAYLAAFSLDNSGAQAPFALLQLGKMLAAFGQTDESCIMLGEVGRRFPLTEAAIEAAGTLVSLNCQ